MAQSDLTTGGLATSQPKPQLLIVEDDLIDASFLSKVLNQDYAVTLSKTVHDTLQLFQKQSEFDMCLVDGTLPDGDGIEICRYIREELKNTNLPIMIITQRKDLGSKVASFGVGADDFISKPYEPLELRARMQALFRRVQKKSELPTYRVGQLVIDRKKQRAYAINAKTGVEESLHLSLTEFRCLDLLASNEGQVFSREQILESVWGSNIHVCDRNVDSFICKLRKKCGPQAMIRSRYGLGYTFTREEQ